MTGNDIGEGARAHRAGKRRFQLITLAQVAAIVAIVAGVLLMRDGYGPGALPQAGAVAAALAIVLVINLGGWWTFRAVDELEARISLISFTLAFYAHLNIYCVWAFLWAGGLLGEPDATVIIVASGLASGIAYIVLKARR